MSARRVSDEKKATKLAIVLNPVADGGRGGRLVDEIGRLFESAGGLDYRMHHTHARGEARTLAARAATEGADVVVAAGGDGTVHEVAAGLLDAREAGVTLPPMGILPIGTGNDYIKTHCIPKRLEAAFERIVAGHRVRVDAGSVGPIEQAKSPSESPPARREYFVNNVGVGFDAEVTARTETVKWLRGASRYLYSVFRTLLTYRPIRLRVEMDETTVEGTFHLVSVGIGRVCGGGFHLTPEADPSDGLFDVHLMKPVSKLVGVLHLPAIKRGDFTGLDFIQVYRTRALTIESAPPIRFHADGEVLEEPGSRLRVETIPGALEVLC